MELPGGARALAKIRAARIIVLGAALICAGAMEGAGFPGAASLPPLPSLDLRQTFPVVRQQIERAYTEARVRPRDAGASGRLGMTLDTYRQYTTAAICYRRALGLDPQSLAWTYNLAYVLYKQGKYAEAAKTFDAALRLNPEYLSAKRNLAACLLGLGRFAEASKLYEEVLRRDPSSAEALYGLGRVKQARGDVRAAAESFQKACELFPHYGAAQYALALADQRLGETAEAAPHFALYQANMTAVPPVVDSLRAAVESLNRGPLTMLRQGIALADDGETQAAIQEHLKAVEADPAMVQGYVNLIQLYARVGEFDKAEQAYRKAVSLDPNRPDCYYNYGVLMFHLRKFDQAEAAFRQALRINPYYPEAHNNLGYLLAIRGRLDDALAEFRSAVEDRPDYRLAHFHMGQVLVEEKKYGEAIAQLEKTLTRTDAETPGYLYALGAAYARAGERRNALRYLRDARDQASARGQRQLLTSIDRDLAELEKQPDVDPASAR